MGLLDERVDPASITILTFSNRAAGELYERFARVRPAESASIWIGTFHAFGLELLRRYHDRLDLPANPTLFDRSDGIAMLEEELPTLGLKRYRDLWNPARELRHMLVAISRAKDELVGEVAYRELAQRMLDAAHSEEERKAAEKAMEVARVYERYQAGLRERGAVDFGDLIMRPAVLLERDLAVRAAVALRHRHVLVDEYQDVNRASARLLSAIVGSGKRLWVVGDSRQSIYRFRGASSVNMTRFAQDYAGAKTDQLALNYRSSSELVAALVAMAPNMGASQQLLPLQFTSNRGASDVPPEIRRVESPADEIDALVAAIHELVERGLPLHDQAVLCRSNPKLADIAAALEARGVPVLHLGSIFERDEVRDLLAVLTLVVDRRGDGLVRVGKMARYGLSLEDVQAVLTWLHGKASAAGPQLHAAADAAELSPSGREGLHRLANDVGDFTAGSAPWEVLTAFALDRSRLVADLAVKTSVVDRMRAVAIWQFLNFARQPVPGTGPRIRRLLTRVRMMVLLAEERDLRRVPAAALHMDAVRLMTVHAAKGLEFEAVHVPGMTKQSFPASRQGDPCPPPHDLIEGGVDLVRAHEEEEQCLFFVAVSRARTHLYLYATARHASGRNRTASPYLDWLRGITNDRQIPSASAAAGGAVEAVRIAWSSGCRVTHDALKSYDRCPRRFLYTHLLDVGTARSPTAYSRTQDCLFDLIGWAATERARRAVIEGDLLEKFTEIWRTKGPTDHAFAADYLRIAERLIRNLARSGEGLAFQEPRAFELDFATGVLIVKPDELATSNGTLVLRRVRPGYRHDEEKDLAYDLLDLAGARAHDGAYVVEAIHLTDDLREVIPVTSKQRGNNAARTARAFAEIHAGRFLPEVSSYNCPQCPHFFICPSLPPGTLTPSDRKK
jgi:superfamily I DNA/RNA helicase